MTTKKTKTSVYFIKENCFNTSMGESTIRAGASLVPKKLSKFWKQIIVDTIL